MDSISFQSTIRPISKPQFNKIVMSYGTNKYVDYPWTIKESVFSDRAYTKHVFDCTVCGITDGAKVLLMHLCPTNKENRSFQRISSYIKKHFDIKNPQLQGFLLGSKPNLFDEKSEQVFNIFEKFFEEHKIPYSKLKGGSHINDVAYSLDTDEWLVSHDFAGNDGVKKVLQTPKKFFDKFFGEVKLSKYDNFSW